MIARRCSKDLAIHGLVLLGLAACGGETAPPETGTIVVVEPVDTDRVARIALRVWDSDLRLVADRLVGVRASDHVDAEVSLPWRIPLRPAGGVVGRWFRVEIDLLDDAWCPYARAQASGAYEPDVVAELRAAFEDLPNDACRAVFVDPVTGTDDGLACTDPSTPCATLDYALDEYTRGAEPVVVYARGGHDYSDRSPSRALDARSAGGAPLVLRAWPGTGMPIVDAGAESDSAIDNCCGDDLASPGLVVDGFEVTGGIRWGVAFNGAGGSGGVVRNCHIHGNGQPVTANYMMLEAATRPLDAGIMSINGPNDLTIEHNRIEGNGVGVSTAWGIHFHHTHGHVVRENRILGNDGGGLRRWDDTMSDVPLVVRENVICDNGGAAVDVMDVSVIEHNTLAHNDGAAFVLRGPEATVRDNIVAGNEGGVYDPDGTVPAEGDSFIHGNGDDDRNDGDPRFTDAATCLLTLLPDSPARGTASDGTDPGAF